MKYNKAKRDSLRALTSEVLPYEVPVPFNTTAMYLFLRRIKFKWINDSSFSVAARNFSKPDKVWLDILFDGINFNIAEKGSLKIFSCGNSLTDRWFSSFNFETKNNNGKSRALSVPHPLSMLGMAYFINEYADSILYYVNRSNYSIRHPRRVAHIQLNQDQTFKELRDGEDIGVEQYNFEYEHVSTYFAYERYNNINRFYTSKEFQAYERKYSVLLRADISKCFDSIYTHTIGWVTNGQYFSKDRDVTQKTFGGKFDHYIQYLNHRETNGIIIGPEFSRIFAEIILQEVDIRVEASLKQKYNLLAGTDYDISRYVDDYFIFASDIQYAQKIEDTLASELLYFKLHLNDHKRQLLETPLESRVSVAKSRIRESISSRTTAKVEPQLDGTLRGSLSFAANKAILDYKAILIDTQLNHGELANTYLYEATSLLEKSLEKYSKYVQLLQERKETERLTQAKNTTISYTLSVIDVALFIYSSSPSVSHGIKLSRLVSTSLRYLESIEISYIQRQIFVDKIQQEIIAQLSSSRGKNFGVHTLNLVDCLFFLNPTADIDVVRSIINDSPPLNAFAVMTFLRCCNDQSGSGSLKSDLLNRAKTIIELGAKQKEYETERSILKLSLPSFKTLTDDELFSTTGISKTQLNSMRRSKSNPGMFAWDTGSHYHERLLLKSVQVVY